MRKRVKPSKSTIVIFNIIFWIVIGCQIYYVIPALQKCSFDSNIIACAFAPAAYLVFCGIYLNFSYKGLAIVFFTALIPLVNILLYVLYAEAMQQTDAGDEGVIVDDTIISETVIEPEGPPEQSGAAAQESARTAHQKHWERRREIIEVDLRTIKRGPDGSLDQLQRTVPKQEALLDDILAYTENLGLPTDLAKRDEARARELAIVIGLFWATFSMDDHEEAFCDVSRLLDGERERLSGKLEELVNFYKTYFPLIPLEYGPSRIVDLIAVWWAKETCKNGIREIGDLTSLRNIVNELQSKYEDA